MNVASKPLLLGTGAGVVVGTLLLCILIALSRINPYDGAPLGQLLFPYAAAINETASAWLILSFLFLQYPLYGALLGVAHGHMRYPRLLLFVLLTLILVGHFSAVLAAHRADAIWIESQHPE
jgi:hypothetical protein